MPYILRKRQAVFIDGLEELELQLDVLKDASPGDLNYLFTSLCIAYLRVKGRNYQGINDVLGALDGAKSEFYRRVAAPYENRKIKVNGDVYPLAFTGDYYVK